MPAKLERSLMRRARKLARSGRVNRGGKKGEDAYVYGTLRKIEQRHQAKGGRPGKYLKNV